ncbi:MAG: cupin domain-containing protein [Bacteriovorax sp.]|nr:cupin domain-containing protein [Bacteriovorax sp.]
MKKTLSALIKPHTTTDFFKAYEKNEPLVIHGLSDSIQDLNDLPFLKSLDNLLNCWPNLIQAHLPDVRDEASSIDTTAKDARKLFDNGMGLLFNHADTISPVLHHWVQELRKDLGLSALTNSRCLIYATPKGSGTAPHFDQNCNFVLQITGVKKWWIAPNTQVSNPMTRHTMGLPIDPELESYLEMPMPNTMPKDIKLIELKAGSLLFLPRGCWHSTEATSDALSLNFTFTPPTWIDLLAAALRGRLAQSSQWRETADGVSDFERSASAIEKFDYLLAGLKADLPTWKAIDILGATETD